MAENTDFFLIAEAFALSKYEGFISLKSYSDFPDRFFQLKSVYIDVFGQYKEFLVEDVQLSGNVVNLKFVNFNTSEDVRFLIGKKIFVKPGYEVKLGLDEYFIHDLIGSRVIKNSVFFGIIEDVICLPANDVYVIKDKDNNEVLIPAIKIFIKSFNPKTKILELTENAEFVDENEN